MRELHILARSTAVSEATLAWYPMPTTVVQLPSFFADEVSKAFVNGSTLSGLASSTKINLLNSASAGTSSSSAIPNHSSVGAVIGAAVSGSEQVTVNEPLLKVPSSSTGVTGTVNRVRFIDTASSKDHVKTKRRQAQVYNKVMSFLQGTVGIELTSSNPDHLPVIVSEMGWADLRSLGTALSRGSAAELEAFVADKGAIKRAVKLLVAELRVRGKKSQESLQGSSVQVSGSTQASSDVSQQYVYALLYSISEDRYEMISYLPSVVNTAVI
jgi:hypothetical protein